jgi:hypothetical protein
MSVVEIETFRIEWAREFVSGSVSGSVYDHRLTDY